MRLKHLFFFIAVLFSLTACFRPGFLAAPTPLPLPTTLATTPLPERSQPGGLEGIFVSNVSLDGEKDSRCHKMYRFYPDGLVLYSDFACFDTIPVAENWPEIARWFERENQELSRGDYYVLDHRLWIRVVTYDSIYETTSLRTFQGEYCNAKMVLQEPSVKFYAGIPSELSQPVLEYVKLATETQLQSTSALSGDLPNPMNADGTDCYAAGFTFIKRPSIVLSDSWAEYQIQTDPGETCTLLYTAPDGSPGLAPGTGAITADSQGICRWTWQVGNLPGNGIVTVSIDEITQDFGIEIR